MEVTKNLGLIKPDRIDAYRDFITKAYALNMDKIDEVLYAVSEILTPSEEYSDVKNGIKVVIEDASALAGSTATIYKPSTIGENYYTVNGGEHIPITQSEQTLKFDDFDLSENFEIYVGADDDGFALVDINRLLSNIQGILRLISPPAHATKVYFPQKYPEQSISGIKVNSTVDKWLLPRQKLVLDTGASDLTATELFVNNYSDKFTEFKCLQPVEIRPPYTRILWNNTHLKKAAFNDVIINECSGTADQFAIIASANLALTSITFNSITCKGPADIAVLDAHANVRVNKDVNFSAPSGQNSRFATDATRITILGKAYFSNVEVGSSTYTESLNCRGDITLDSYSTLNVSNVTAQNVIINSSNNVNYKTTKYTSNMIFNASAPLGWETYSSSTLIENLTFEKSLTLNGVTVPPFSICGFKNIKIGGDLVINALSSTLYVLSQNRVSNIEIGGNIKINNGVAFLLTSNTATQETSTYTIRGSIVAESDNLSINHQILTSTQVNTLYFYGSIKINSGAFMCGIQTVCNAYFYNDNVETGNASVFMGCSNLTIHGVQDGKVHALAKKANVKFEPL